MNNSVEYLKKYLPSDKLEEGIPVQYIVGNVEFYNSIIKVDNRVLIPRFETELLVEKLIKYIRLNFNNKINILDMCTGSGCIAISLKKEIDCNMDAVDISNDALNVARDNMVSNNVNINFILSDLFTNVKSKYDVIVSNPPYISYDFNQMNNVNIMNTNVEQVNNTMNNANNDVYSFNSSDIQTVNQNTEQTVNNVNQTMEQDMNNMQANTDINGIVSVTPVMPETNNVNTNINNDVNNNQNNNINMFQ